MASDAEELTSRLERIKRLTEQLLLEQQQSTHARSLADRIRREIDLARDQLKPINRA